MNKQKNKDKNDTCSSRLKYFASSSTFFFARQSFHILNGLLKGFRNRGSSPAAFSCDVSCTSAIFALDKRISSESKIN